METETERDRKTEKEKTRERATGRDFKCGEGRQTDVQRDNI